MKKLLTTLAILGFLIPSISYGAIAFDATSQGSAASATVTISHTIGSGSNRALVVACYGNNQNQSATGVTYPKGGSATAMTSAGTTAGGSPTSGDTNMWYMLNPDTGTGNIVATFNTATNSNTCHATSYTGVAQAGQPDAYTFKNLTAATQNITTTLTTIANNTWTVLYVRAGGVGTAITAGTGSTIRGTNSAEQAQIFDSNGALSVGSNSMTANSASASTVWTTNMLSLAPAVAPSTPTCRIKAIGRCH